MKTYAYIRVSTDKQDLENQKFVILQYAKLSRLVRSITSIAKILGVHYHTVRSYIKRRDIK